MSYMTLLRWFPVDISEIAIKTILQITTNWKPRIIMWRPPRNNWWPPDNKSHQGTKYPFPNFIGCTVEISDCISYIIPHVIIYIWLLIHVGIKVSHSKYMTFHSRDECRNTYMLEHPLYGITSNLKQSKPFHQINICLAVNLLIFGFALCIECVYQTTIFYAITRLKFGRRYICVPSTLYS